MEIKFNPTTSMPERYRTASAALKIKIAQDQRNGHPIPTPEQGQILLKRLAETGTTEDQPESQ